MTRTFRYAFHCIQATQDAELGYLDSHRTERMSRVTNDEIYWYMYMDFWRPFVK